MSVRRGREGQLLRSPEDEKSNTNRAVVCREAEEKGKADMMQRPVVLERHHQFVIRSSGHDSESLEGAG